MSKELEALDGLANFIIVHGNIFPDTIFIWHGILKQALTELEELKRDVKRYFELEDQDTFNSQAEYDEYGDLVDKLMKVGKEE